LSRIWMMPWIIFTNMAARTLTSLWPIMVSKLPILHSLFELHLALVSSFENQIDTVQRRICVVHKFRISTHWKSWNGANPSVLLVAK
jgi:hypothetical protein